MFKWNYSIEVQRVSGDWSHGTIWACCPSNFRALLRYINGESDPCTGSIIVRTNGPPTRIRRAENNVEPDFRWPDDRKLAPGVTPRR